MEKRKQQSFQIPKMYPKQQAIFSSPARVKVVQKGRQVGFTQGCAVHLIKCMILGTKKLGLWVDTRGVNIDKVIEEHFIGFVLTYLPKHLWTWRRAKRQLIFKNNQGGYGKIDFGSAENPEGLEGFNYDVVVLNEAGHILKNEALWYSTVLPMTIRRRDCEIYIGGSPRGKGLFFKLAMDAKENEDWELFKLTMRDNPFNAEETIKALEDSLPELYRLQEIEGEFLDDGGTVFRGISKCIKGDLEEPKSGKRYKAGIDLARKADWTAICILDQNNHLCHFERMKNTDWTIQKARIRELLKRYNATALVDSSGIGDPILSDLEDMNLKVKPYQFTQKSKIQLIEQLMIGIEKQELSFPQIDVLINELESFEFDMGPTNIKYGVQSEHDDTVISLALSYWETTMVKPFVCRDIPAQREPREKSIFDMQKEYEETGSYTRYRW